MRRDTPCPIAGNSQHDCPVYYDPFYRDWVEAVLSEIGDGKYAVTTEKAIRSNSERYSSMFFPMPASTPIPVVR